jgi:hypothetical protein
MSALPAASERDRKPPPNLCAEKGRHSDSVRTRRELTAGKEIVQILLSEKFAVRM